MGRRKTLSEATGAEEIPAVPPIRFVADYDHVEPLRTIAFKAGMILEPEPTVRAAALASGKAVEHGD